MFNKKGFFTIEAVIILMMFVLVFVFTFDLTVVMWNKLILRQTVNSVGRIIAVQGGVQNYYEPYFPIVRNSDFFNILNRRLSNFDEYKLFVDSIEVKTSTIKHYEYGDIITVEIRGKITWRGLLSYFGGNDFKERELSAKTKVISQRF